MAQNGTNTIDWINLLGIIAASIIGLVNIWTTRHASKLASKATQQAAEVAAKATKQSILLAEKNRWRDKTRESISELCGNTKSWMLGLDPVDPKLAVHLVNGIDCFIPYVKLSLNPNGNVEGEIIKLLEEIPKHTSPNNYNTLMAKIERLQNLSQKLFKEDWDQIIDEIAS